MNNRAAIVLRGLLWGAASGGFAVLVVVFAGDISAKTHAWFLLAVAVLFAISDSYFKSLLSELSAVLRRGTYSVWQLEKLNQSVPILRKQVGNAWLVSMWLKAIVGIDSAYLLAETDTQYRSLALFIAYTCMLYSIFFAIWGRRNFRRLEKEVDALTLMEASMKEKTRLVHGMEAGVTHEFKNDKLAEGYTNPPTPI